MDFIPIEPDENLEAFLNSFNSIPITFIRLNNPGDPESENIILQATEDISLSDYILFCEVEDTETGIPDYGKSRYLTFDAIEIEKGGYIQIFTGAGTISRTIGFDNGNLHEVVYWNLPAPIWHQPHVSLKIQLQNDSIETSVRPE